MNRIAELAFDDGKGLKLSERYLRTMIRDSEAMLAKLPETLSVQALLNRVEAGFRLPSYIRVAEIDLEDAHFLLDGLHGGQTQYISSDNKPELS